MCWNSSKLCQFVAVILWENWMCCAVYNWTLGMCPLFARSGAGDRVFTFTILYIYILSVCLCYIWVISFLCLANKMNFMSLSDIKKSNFLLKWTEICFWWLTPWCTRCLTTFDHLLCHDWYEWPLTCMWNQDIKFGQF